MEQDLTISSTTKMIAINDLAKVRWRCHRGMLELDLLMLNFYDNCYVTLEDDMKQLFIELLLLEDPELWDIVLQINLKEEYLKFEKIAAMIQKAYENKK